MRRGTTPETLIALPLPPRRAAFSAIMRIIVMRSSLNILRISPSVSSRARRQRLQRQKQQSSKSKPFILLERQEAASSKPRALLSSRRSNTIFFYGRYNNFNSDEERTTGMVMEKAIG